jgi:hypothetical protein
VACIVALGTACSDGYPTADEPRPTSALTSTERLAAKNRLGAEAQRGRRWRYALESDCLLQVDAGHAGPPPRSIALEGATTARTFDRAAALYAVVVTPAAAASVPVLVTPHWTDSTEMMTHLQEQLRTCTSAPANRPTP